MFLTSAGAALLLVAGAGAYIGAGPAASDAGSAARSPQAVVRDRADAEAGDIRFLVDKSDREVRVFRGGQLFRVHAVAVGAPEFQTPSGRWAFERVDINPEWIPPDSPWAAGEPRRPPGDPQNPMGQARLVFNMPYTLHGTDDLASLGTAASHGSIRVANQDVIPLAELLLRAGGAWQGREWFEGMVRDRNTEFEIPLPHPVPIEVRE
jgi:lipoprotein-anchoring transpeptidase ErfK/SrfK